MTKPEMKLKIAMGIRNAYIAGKTDHIKLSSIIDVMNEKRITRTQLKQTIRVGNAAFILKEDDKDLSKTKALTEEICTWIDNNISKEVGK